MAELLLQYLLMIIEVWEEDERQSLRLMIGDIVFADW
jgi:hypothetical protein